jgi:hypothetical protein
VSEENKVAAYMRLLLPLTPSREAFLFVPTDMSAEEVDYLIKQIAVMKRGLVRMPLPEPPATGEGR